MRFRVWSIGFRFRVEGLGFRALAFLPKRLALIATLKFETVGESDSAGSSAFRVPGLPETL